jgi:uncharacterized protein YcfL
MKKFLLSVILVLLLSACSSDEITEIEFNDHIYTLEEVSTDGYDMFLYDTYLVEILFDETDNSFILTTEMDGDIYIVQGTIEEYTVSKNGSTILIDGIDLIATGSEYVNWNEDIIPIMQQYVK